MRDIQAERQTDRRNQRPRSRARAAPIVTAIHTAVRGRARYRVAGLRRSESLKKLIERNLAEISGIDRVSANPLTGNVLVLFNGDLNADRIGTFVERIVRNASESGANSNGGRPRRRQTRADQLTRASPSGERRAWSMPDLDGGEQRREAWHVVGADAVLAGFQTSAKAGLSEKVADERIKAYGPNILPEAEPRSPFSILLDQFSSWPVALLSAAAGISVLTGGLADAVAIMGVVAINAAIGYVTESKSDRTIRSLKTLVQPTAVVIRDRKLREIPAQQTVVGDILVLKPGSYVAADSRLIEVRHLSLDESTLTGESMPVSKVASQLNSPDVPLPDRINMVYMGTLVTGGQGLAVVVATGSSTELGKIQKLAAEAQSPETPMERQLARMGNQLVLIAAAVCGAVFLVGLLRGFALFEMLKTSISLAVAALPEGLPTVATTTLALGVLNMRKRHVIIRRLDAVETLGCVQTVCLDKTGTLTLNRMAVASAYSGMKRFRVEDGQLLDNEKKVESRPDEITALIEVCVLCSESSIEKRAGQYILNGSPTENALIHMAIGAGVDVLRLREEYATLRVTVRSEDRNFMSTLHRTSGPSVGRFRGPFLVAVKGSPAEVLAMCGWQLKDGQRVPFTEEERWAIDTENQRMAARRLRILGCAYRDLEGTEIDGEVGDGLTWLGLVGMADPVRGGVEDAIDAFHRAGIDTVMITGDQSATAYAIGKELGLGRDGPLEILDSTHLGDIDPGVLKAVSEKVQVFARVSPANKLQIVQALQRASKVVAMTGDGINDGPALKAADIGIAMGQTGTDVAREVADVVLEDDNLQTMLVAIGQGRTIYRNIRKSVHFLLSTNLSEIIVMFSAIAAGLGQPLTAMQLLWINLISDVFPGLALALEPPEADVMTQAPRDPAKPIVQASDFARIGAEGAALSAGALAAYGYGLARYGAGPRATTLAFTSLASGQLLHATSCRSETHSVFDETGLPPNPYLTVALAGSFGAQALTFVVPQLRSLLGIAPISVADAAAIGASLLLPFVVNETTKRKAILEYRS